VRPRLLYWFRTPPNVKVGRQPFDEAVRRALEAQNPDIQFDWQTILDTPIPPPVEVERWRERRRFERAARQAEADEAGDAANDPAAAGEPGAAHIDSSIGPLQAFDVTTSIGDVQPLPSPVRCFGEPGKPDTPAAPGGRRADDAVQGAALDVVRRKRRRRGRRGRPIATGSPAAPDSVVPPQIGQIEPFDPEGE
jgi:hypothetical protein